MRLKLEGDVLTIFCVALISMAGAGVCVHGDVYASQSVLEHQSGPTRSPDTLGGASLFYNGRYDAAAALTLELRSLESEDLAADELRYVGAALPKPGSAIVAVLAMVVVCFGMIDAKTTTLSGWVSDESCGPAHITPGNESCVAKCLRGGASVGHPEWLPQRMVLVSDDGKTTWIVQNPDILINQAGLHVLVDARYGLHANSVRILRVRSR